MYTPAVSFQSKSLKQVSQAEKAASRMIVLVSASQLKSKTWSKGLEQKLSNRLVSAMGRLSEPLKENASLKVTGVHKDDADVVIATLPEDLTSFSLLGAARGVLKSILDASTENLSIIVLDSKHEAILAEVFSSAIATRIFQMPVYGKRAEKLKPFKLKNVFFYSSKSHERALRESFTIATGTNLVRYLGTMPPNDLNSAHYGKVIKELCTKFKIGFKFHTNAQLKKMGAGAFTAVDQGDPDSKGGIYELTYQNSKAKNKKWVTLVGKGLCFDTGGHDIKTGGYMLTMKGDMQGSAVALANLVVASQLKLPVKMKAFLGVTENYLSPKAYKADEVVTALNGKAIEVINTDAEGRMVLADTLCLASNDKPELMIDYATLTGAATIAIGTSYSAGFTNRDEYHQRIIDAGKESGERVWTFPLDPDFGKALESQVADLIQCIKGRGPDHILAAYFLKEFVDKETPWVHIDLAAADKEGGLAHVDTLFTGFGVKWTMQFLRNKYKF